MDCPKCRVELKPGKAIEQTWTGEPEWPGCEVLTLSPGGTGKLTDCLKCPTCGYSARYTK